MAYLSDGNYGNYLNLAGGAGATIRPPALSFPLPHPGYVYQLGTISSQVVTSYVTGSTDFSIINPTGTVFNKQTDGSTGLIHTSLFQPITPLVILPGDNWALQLAVQDITPPAGSGSGTVGIVSAPVQGWALSGTGDPVAMINGGGGYMYLPDSSGGTEQFVPQAIPTPTNQGINQLTVNYTGFFDGSYGYAALYAGNTVLATQNFPSNVGFTAYSFSYNYSAPQPVTPTNLSIRFICTAGGSSASYQRVNNASLSWASAALPNTGALNAYVSISVEGQQSKWPS